eukprot:8864097-Alexandrium_andersonii.AAC.1
MGCLDVGASASGFHATCFPVVPAWPRPVRVAGQRVCSWDACQAFGEVVPKGVEELQYRRPTRYIPLAADPPGA